MKTAIVILNYNDAATTLSYLDVLQGYTVYDHIIVVDNASTAPTDEIQACCRRIGADFMQAAQNRGYASGNNLGIRHAIEQYGAEVIFVSNPDIICSQEAARAVVSAFSEHERIGIASGLIHVYDEDHKTRPFSAFAYRVPKTSDMLLNCLLVTTKLRRMRGKGSIYYDPAQVKRQGYLYVEAISGCFFAISQDAFLAVDGLDEDTFLYNEEAILGYRLRAKGYRGVVLDVPVIHDEKRDKAVGWKKQWRTGKLTRESARVYMRKYLGCGPFTLAVYTAMSAIGCVERYLISWVLR